METRERKEMTREEKEDKSETEVWKKKKGRGRALKNLLFLGSGRQHTQSARVTLTADAILTFWLSFFKSHIISLALCTPPTLYVFHKQFAGLKINATRIRLRQIFHLPCQLNLCWYDKWFKRGHWHCSTSVTAKAANRPEKMGRKCLTTMLSYKRKIKRHLEENHTF